MWISIWLFGLICVFSTCKCANETPTRDPQCHSDHLGEECSSSSLWTHDKYRSTDLPASQQSDYASQLIEDLHIKMKKTEQELAQRDSYPPDYRPEDGEEFDFVVVGAGSAGSVVANRLTEVGAWKVLLVEAGGDPTVSSEIPGLAVTMQMTDIDWQYKTEPEEYNCLGMVNRSCNWPRGKVLGGSSTINYMMYVRGNAKDYDGWAKAGNTGWGYEDVLPYFKKSEDMRSPEVWKMEDAEKYHGKGGYVKIESWTDSEASPLMQTFGKGLEELGYPFNPDYNGKTQRGFTRFYGTLDNRRRCSNAKAFLSPIKRRKNLKISRNSLIKRVLIDKNTNRAYGVELLDKDGQVIKIMARKEIVLSAGAINTPQILMLSGVGPKQHLKDLGLSVVHDLPVGHNLQDHALMNSLVVSTNYSIPLLNHEEGILEFLTTGSGKLSNLRFKTYTAFINTNEDEDNPDIQFLHYYISKNDSKMLNKFLGSFGVREDIIKEYAKINEQQNSVFLLGSLMRPFSRGKILLKSTDPTDHPTIFAGLLTDNRDIETFLRTYGFVERLVNTDVLRRVGAELHEVRLPGCEKHPFPSREYRECSLRHLTATTYHYCGTCKMGPPSDSGAVVDPSLRVFGVKGLRVADASVMPTIVSGNINAAVTMIGEKASDLIKEEWL